MVAAAQLSIFDVQYPHDPGHRSKDTSRAAARRAWPTDTTFRARALQTLRVRPMTADEVAEVLGESVLIIRPRVAQLHRLGQVVDTGARRLNRSGNQAIVWRAA